MQKTPFKRKFSGVPEKQADTVLINQLSKKAYTSTSYRLLVYLYIPLIFLYPFVANGYSIGALLTGVMGFVFLYELPEIIGLMTKPNNMLARKDGTAVQLFLERDYVFDLVHVTSIQLSTGCFPISPVKLKVVQKDRPTLLIETRIQSSNLVRFLRALRAADWGSINTGSPP